MSIASLEVALERFTTFGDLLKFLRRRAGLTQRELSIAVGYSDAQISRLEQNERMPDLATISARFLPVLMLDDVPEVTERLLELASAVRREDAPASGLPPYKGLFYFDESDAELFFGREKLTASLMQRLSSGLESGHRFLTVIGASGSGKSSLVRAGLIPALRWRKESSGWPLHVMTPTAHPLEALAESLSEHGKIQSMVREFSDTAQGLHKTLDLLARNAGVEHTLLVIDQFEELFTLCRNEDEQHAFVENVLTAALQPNGKALVVIVMRADFYAHCAQFDLLRQSVSSYQEYIGPMSMDDLRRVIEEPAKRGHWEIEPGLVEVLLHDVGADVGRAPEPGALPLLSHALLETWQRRRGHTMTLSGYIASGGVRGAIAETAETVFYDKLDQRQREIARQIFLRLTELGGDTSTADTRRRVSFDELVTNQSDHYFVRDVLSTLADARLITTDQNVAEVAHEALIREWPTLRNWLEENREGLRLHRHLTVTAQEWDTSNRDPSMSYRGARLAQALEWADEHANDLNMLERSFLDESKAYAEQEAVEREAYRQRELETAQKLAETERKRAEEQTKSNKRLRQRAVFLTTAFLLAGILAVIAGIFWQRTIQSNKLAVSRELSAAAVNNLQIDPERSVLLALQALDEVDTLEARNALHRALPELHLLLTIPAHSGAIPDVTISPDGMRLASINDDGTATIWDTFSGESIVTMVNENSYPSLSVPRSLAFSPDGKTLATSDATEVILWDVSTGKRLYSLTGESIGTTTGIHLGVGQISFKPDGNHLAVANMDGVPKVWDLATRSEVLSFTNGELPARVIAYSPDGNQLAGGGDEGIVRIWNPESGEEVFALPLGGIVQGVSFGIENDLLAGASADGSVKIWDSKTGKELLSLPRMSGLYDIAFLSDGSLVTAGQDGTTRVWDSSTGQELLTLAGHSSTVIGVATSPDGTRIVTSGYDGTVRIWDAQPGRELLTMHGHADMVWDVSYNPDEKQIASASADGTVKIWDAESGQLMLTLINGDNPGSGFASLAFSPDGGQIAAGGMDGTVTLWDSNTGERLMLLTGHTNMVVGLAYSPDGKRLASAGWDGIAKVWDLVSGKEITTFSGHRANSFVTGITFDPDGKRVFTGADDKFVRMWDAATGQELTKYSGEDREIYGIAISPDGKLLAMGNQDGVVILWDVNSGKKLHTMSGHAGLVMRLTFNRDGTQLASASFDQLAKVWDIYTGEEVVSLYGNTGNVFGVSFSPDGNYLATGGADGTVHTYTLKIEELVALANSRLTRSLTSEECKKYLHMDDCPNIPDNN